MSTHILTDGTEIVVRPASPGDASALAGLFQRAQGMAENAQGVASLSEAQLVHLIGADLSLVALAVDGSAVGLAKLSFEPKPAQLEVIVDEGRAGIGIGDALTQRMMAAARDLDCPRVRAVVLPAAIWAQELVDVA